MIGLDLMVEESSQMEETASDFTYGCRRRGVHLLFGCGIRSFRIIPPLTISRAEINKAIDLTDEALNERTGKRERPKKSLYQSSHKSHALRGRFRFVAFGPGRADAKGQGTGRAEIGIVMNLTEGKI